MEHILEVRNLNVYYKSDSKSIFGKASKKQVLFDINFDVNEGEIFGIVGESGCGKSTLSKAVLGMNTLYDGEIIHHSVKPQMIFQDPYSSINPHFSVGETVLDPLRVSKTITDKNKRMAKVTETMELCGLPERYFNTYPHELDGGRRQRVGLARALVLDPEFIVCDEPVSALDVSIQAQILNLLMDLQEQRKIAYMFITHDLCVVRHISHEIMVMYMGQVVEYASRDELFRHPVHPYTVGLLNAIPTVDLSKRNRERHLLSGEVSNPIDPAPGCRFANRCPYASEKCKEPQVLTEIAPNHFVACHECVK